MTLEQVAARVTLFGQQLIELARTVPVQSINKAVCGALILWLLFALLQLAGVFFSRDAIPDDTDKPSAEGSVLRTGDDLDISQLQSINLFGEVGAVSAPQTEIKPATVADDIALNAVKTKLNLTLKGIVYSPDDGESLAVIVFQNKQDRYYIGDRLPTGNKVSLTRVMPDHVILDNNGRYESLWLYDQEKPLATTSQASSAKAKQKILTDNRSSAGITKLAKGYRDRLYKNPTSLAQVLQISPAQKDGKMLGYRVKPGSDRKQFAQLGFKTNDIVTSINGIELDEPSKALEIYKLMRTASEAAFVVNRNGASVEVLVSLGD